MQTPGPIDPVVVARVPAADPRRDILGLSRAELRAALVESRQRYKDLVEAGVPERQAGMRAGQVWHWVYHRGVTDFQAMANVSKDVRARLEEQFRISRPEIVEAQ